MEEEEAAKVAAEEAPKVERSIPVKNVPRQNQDTQARKTTATGKTAVGAAMLWTGVLVFVAKGYLGKVAEWISGKVA